MYPGSEGSMMPGYGGSSMPGYGGSSMPGYGGSSMPGYGGPMPGYGPMAAPGTADKKKEGDEKAKPIVPQFLTATRYDFVVQFCWQEKTVSDRI
jgi:hypothetical protein